MGGPREPISRQLALGLERIRARAGRKGQPTPAVLAYFQAYSGTFAQPGRLRDMYGQILANPMVDGVIISTRPDCLDNPRWEEICRLALRRPLWLELGLQSAHDATLAALGRGHDAACFARAAAQAQSRGLRVVAHVILGLPGETPDHTRATADFLARLDVWGVKMHNLMILANTRLAAQWREGSFSPWSRETWARAAADFLVRLPPRTIVHRLAADPGPDELLAPGWASDKDRSLTMLAKIMVSQNLSQGDLCRA